MQNFVTVLIPNYNHEDFLEQRINSVLSQTFQNFEIIILDDCSKDNSKQIIEKYRNHPKISQIVYNESNSGSTFLQWDKGINSAKGNFIWIAESDDWCETILLETCMKMLEKNQKMTLSYVQSYYVIGENKIKWVSKSDEIEKYINGKQFVKQYLSINNAIINASMVVFRKDIYYKISKNYTQYKFCGDWLFWAEIASWGDVGISGKVLNYFRNHDKDVSGKAYKSGFNFIEEFQLLNELFTKNLFSKNEFDYALKVKYLRYKFSNEVYSLDYKKKIETLFFNLDTNKNKKLYYLKIFYFQRLKNLLKNIINSLK